jgi:hypothetical protein
MLMVGLAFQIRSIAAVSPWPTRIFNDLGHNPRPALVSVLPCIGEHNWHLAVKTAFNGQKSHFICKKQNFLLE